MNMQSTRQGGSGKLGGLALAACIAAAACMTAGLAQTAAAQERPLTAQTVIDRAEIEDLLTRYYYNLGHSTPEGFSAFYAEGAELVLGKNSYKGKEGIEGAYKSAGQNAPQMKAFSFNVLLSNPLVVVRGNTATAQLIFTEVLIDKEGDPPRIFTQGKEYDNLVKVGGHWRFSKRQIMGANQEPPGWGR